VDVQTNTLTVFSIVEALKAVDFPANVPEVSVLTLWLRRAAGEDGAKFAQRIRVIDPDGNELRSIEIPFRLERPRQRVQATFTPFDFERAGRYQIEISIREEGRDWSEPAASYPIDVQLAPQDNLTS
jgi:hypothetical protein